MTIGWAFSHNEDGTWDGWNNPAIAGFKNNRLENLTRETIQNSLDASASDDEPVYVTMVEQRLGKERIPNFDMLEDTLALCWEKRGEESENSIEELRIARSVAGKDTISVLTISDENTTGMAGLCVHGKPFFSYLKAFGQSGGSEDRGGSHGIGKAAPLCASDLRTIFASTRWEDAESGNEKCIVQGRTTLMSHLQDGKTMSGVGFWGHQKSFDAVDEGECGHDWLKRDEIGTSIHVVGWNCVDTREWELCVLGWAAINFFPAFARDKLVLIVGDKKLHQENVKEILHNPKLLNLMEKVGKADGLRNAQYYLRCITQEGVIAEETQLKILGRSSVKILMEDDAPRKIAIIRKNMHITDKLRTFWKRGPTRLRDFVGVFECLDPEGEKLIRAMEPPAHNDISKDNLPITKMDRGSDALRELVQKLKDIVSKYASNEVEEAGEIDFLKEYFADEADDGVAGQELEERDPSGHFLITPRPVNLPPTKPVDLAPDQDEPDDPDPPMEDEGPGEDGGAGDEPGGGGGEGGGTGSGFGTGEDGTGDQERPTRPTRPTRPSIHEFVKLNDCRLVRLGTEEIRLHATPNGSGNVLIEILEVGADNDEELSISSSNVGEVKDGLLSLRVKKGERLSILLKTSRPVVGGMKAIANSAT